MIEKYQVTRQTVAVSRPDRETTVQGPRGTDETLVRDGKLDDFIASESSHFPMRSLKDLQELVNSEKFAELKGRQAARKDDNWIFHDSPHTDRSTHPVLSIVSQNRRGVELSWGGQRAVLNGDQVTLTSQVNHLGNFEMEHTIHGQKNDQGEFVCTAETYQMKSGFDGNLWATVAEALK